MRIGTTIDTVQSAPLLRRQRGRLKLHNETLDERMQQANALNGYLLIIEIMMAGELQRYGKRAYDIAIADGLYKQQAKKQVNELCKLVETLQYRCLTCDAERIMMHIFENMPCYARRYMKEGGGTVIRFQSALTARSKDITNHIFLSAKNLLDKRKAAHSELCATLLTMNALSTTAIEAYDVIASHQNRLLAGDLVIKRDKSDHHERILRLCSDLLRPYISYGLVNDGSKEVEQSREFVRQLQVFISGESLDNIAVTTFSQVVMEYVEFVLACICIDMKDGRLPNDVTETLINKLGSQQQADEVLRELSDVSVPDDADAWDLIDSMPVGIPTGALRKYRRICYERHDLPDQPDVKVVL